jgi:hypothetical protein
MKITATRIFLGVVMIFLLSGFGGPTPWPCPNGTTCPVSMSR